MTIISLFTPKALGSSKASILFISLFYGVGCRVSGAIFLLSSTRFASCHPFSALFASGLFWEGMHFLNMLTIID